MLFLVRLLSTAVGGGIRRFPLDGLAPCTTLATGSVCPGGECEGVTPAAAARGDVGGAQLARAGREEVDGLVPRESARGASLLAARVSEE